MPNNKKKLIPKYDVFVHDENSAAENKQLQLFWSRLHDDLKKLMLERVNWVDRVRFCLVSKQFLRLMHEIPCRPADKLPWLFWPCFKQTSYGEFLSKCKLREPFSQFAYSVRIVDREARTYLHDAKPFASSHGWVLLRGTSWEYYNQYYFSLYRPYDNKFVKLPELKVGRDFLDGKATISVDQTSLISVFYACLEKTGHTINISICDVGATSWENLRILLHADGPKVEILEHALYADEFVYCVFDDGCKFVTFDVMLHDWEFFSCDFHPHEYLFPPCYAVYDGDLIMLQTHTCSSSSFGSLSYSWRFDKSLKQWVQQESLGDLALFHGDSSIFPVKAVGELSCYANTVHNLVDWGTLYMSFSSGKFQYSELYQASNRQLRRSKNYCWIEPPHLTQTEFSLCISGLTIE